MTYFFTSAPPDVWNASISCFNQHQTIISIISQQQFMYYFTHFTITLHCTLAIYRPYSGNIVLDSNVAEFCWSN